LIFYALDLLINELYLSKAGLNLSEISHSDLSKPLLSKYSEFLNFQVFTGVLENFDSRFKRPINIDLQSVSNKLSVSIGETLGQSAEHVLIYSRRRDMEPLKGDGSAQPIQELLHPS
jgi:hypothetical protein